MNFNYPVFLGLQGKKCVVIGGGIVATRKVKALLRAGAQVTVIARQTTQKILKWVKQKKIRFFSRSFRPSDLKGAWLVIAATHDHSLNEAIAKQAQKKRQWINVVDKPALCQLIYPSVIRKGKLTLAISTDGASPALAKAIRKDLEKNFIPRYQKVLDKIAKLRPKVLATVPSIEKRRQLLNRMAQGLLKNTR